MQNTDKLLYKELKKLEEQYQEPITIADGLHFDFQESLKIVEYYLNSRYINGDTDEFGDKPFMNIVNANADVSKVATDFDTKDIKVESDDGDSYDMSLVFNKEIYDWMKVTNFAKTLNEMNSKRVDYGECLVKKVEKVVDGEKTLVIETPEWQNLRVDASNILGSPIVEYHYMSLADFAEKDDVWENVREVLKTIRGRKDNDGQVIVKQITGKFPVAVYKDCQGETVDEEDEFIYERYCFYVACIGEQNFFLYAEEKDEDIYKLLSWKKVAKRPAKGVVEEGIPAQIWTNDVIQKEHRWFELASKAVLQSASRALRGRNILSEVENGIVLEHEDGKPITAVNLVASAVPEFQNLIEKWGSQYEKTTSTYDSVRGETPPSGQAFRLQALIQQQGASSFDHRREEMGIFIVELFNDWIMPYLVKKINKEHILSSDYTADELKKLDANYAKNMALDAAKEVILSGKLYTQEEYEAAITGYAEFISQTKERRFLDIPKNYYKDFKPRITFVTTGEQKNKMAALETLSNLLTVYLTNPDAVKADPVASQLFAKIIEISGAGISPMTLGLGQNNQATTPTQTVAPQTGMTETSTMPNPKQLAPEAQQA